MKVRLVFSGFLRLIFFALPLAIQVSLHASPLEPKKSTFTQQTVDGIIATVGEEIILFSDLQRAVRATTNGETQLLKGGKLEGGSISPEQTQALLDQLLNQKVLGMRVREMGIDVGEDELDSEINGMLRQQNINPEDFPKILEQEGESVESHREEFRSQLETQRFIGKVIRPLVSVTEDEVRNFYFQQAGNKSASEKVIMRSLMINMGETLSEAQKQAKQERINSIRKEVDSGSAFLSLVRQYSESPDAIKSEGKLSPRYIRELPQELQERLKSANIGQVIGPLSIGSSVFFFEFVGFEKNSQSDFEKNKTLWENKLLEVKFKERLDDYIKAETTKVKVIKRPLSIFR